MGSSIFKMGRSKRENVLEHLKNVLESSKMYFGKENVHQYMKNVLQNAQGTFRNL
jgi:hypothetical protein